MKKELNYLFLIIGLTTVLFTCDDILEEDIEGDLVSVISPLSGHINQGNTVNFSWRELDAADDYRLQVLENNQQIIVDSTVSSTFLDLNLLPGPYQWRIKGQNFAYETDYTFPINFSVEISDDLSDQVVELETPSDNFYTNDASVIITWMPIPTATSYDIEVEKIDNSGQSIILQQPDATNTSFTLQSSILADDAEYVWKVRAKNVMSQTLFSEQSLFVDRVVPSIPILNTPADASTNDTAVTFNWSNGTDSGTIQSTVTNTIEIATDANFNSIIDTNTTETNSYQYTFSATGDYFWRIRAIDLAGNASENSVVRTITIE